MADQKGVTLIEILCTLVIVSIISAIAYPPLLHLYRTASFMSEESELVSWLHMAKSEAVKTDSYVVIKAREKGYTIFVDNSGTAPDWVREKNEHLLTDYTLKKGITLKSTFTRNRFRFGIKPGIKGGSFILKDLAGHHLKIIIDMIGRIRVQ
jgi:prepilin-type N-terminal cleavage/methylation domain-containing protein